MTQINFGFYFCLFLVYSVIGDDGFCGIEPPKEGASCSGSKPIDSGSSKNIENLIIEKLVYDDFPENETEIWKKRFYQKIAFTTSYDWSIHELLDDAEDLIVNDAQKSIQKLEAILETHPDSPRANYDLVRAMQLRMTEREASGEVIPTEERQKFSLEVVERWLNLMSKYRPLAENVTQPIEEESVYVLPPGIYSSAVHQALSECEASNLTALSALVLEKAFEFNSDFTQAERYHVVLIEKYYVLENWEALETALDRAAEKFPGSTLLKFFKGLLLKHKNNKKEANKILREIQYESESASQFADEMEHIGLAFYNMGKPAKALELFREVSKTHAYLNSYQRPALPNPDLESVPVWNSEEQVTLTKHDEEFEAITSRWTEIKEEVVALSKNLTYAWKSHTKTMSYDHNLIQGSGNWSMLPLFSWGKRKPYSCSLAPKTCATFKEKFPTSAHCGIGVIKFEALLGHTRVLPHVGPTNSRLRLLLPLVVPENIDFKFRIGKDTQIPFVEGKIVVIDDSYEHEIVNNGDETVIWLAADFPHPDLPFGEDKKSKMSPYARKRFLFY